MGGGVSVAFNKEYSEQDAMQLASGGDLFDKSAFDKLAEDGLVTGGQMLLYQFWRERVGVNARDARKYAFAVWEDGVETGEALLSYTAEELDYLDIKPAHVKALLKLAEAPRGPTPPEAHHKWAVVRNTLRAVHALRPPPALHGDTEAGDRRPAAAAADEVVQQKLRQLSAELQTAVRAKDFRWVCVWDPALLCALPLGALPQTPLSHKHHWLFDTHTHTLLGMHSKATQLQDEIDSVRTLAAQRTAERHDLAQQRGKLVASRVALVAQRASMEAAERRAAAAAADLESKAALLAERAEVLKKKAGVCSACHDNAATALNLPCHHRFMCGTCTDTFREANGSICPMCREPSTVQSEESTDAECAVCYEEHGPQKLGLRGRAWDEPPAPHPCSLTQPLIMPCHAGPGEMFAGKAVCGHMVCIGCMVEHARTALSNKGQGEGGARGKQGMGRHARWIAT